MIRAPDQNWAPADMVGERPQGEDGGEEADREDSERQREKRCGQVPLLFVDHQQRHQRACREIQTRERDRCTRQSQSGGQGGAAPSSGRLSGDRR